MNNSNFENFIEYNTAENSVNIPFIKEGIITIERVEGAVDFIEWRIKTGQTKSTNRIDDIVKLTEKGEELVKQIEAGVKKDKLCWFWVIYCAEMVILVNMNVVELVNT
ncbi:unnamed protein product [Rhizophagus irregularis]|nr:unnamed protein product [Rhizophagus irregularis]